MYMYLVDRRPMSACKRAWALFNPRIGKQVHLKCLLYSKHFGGVKDFGGSQRALPST